HISQAGFSINRLFRTPPGAVIISIPAVCPSGLGCQTVLISRRMEQLLLVSGLVVLLHTWRGMKWSHQVVVVRSTAQALAMAITSMSMGAMKFMRTLRMKLTTEEAIPCTISTSTMPKARPLASYPAKASTCRIQPTLISFSKTQKIALSIEQHYQTSQSQLGSSN